MSIVSKKKKHVNTRIIATIDKSVADDIELYKTMLNENDKNHVIGGLLKYALSVDKEFRSYKKSLRG